MPETGRVVILGAGLAALSAALELAPHPVLVISPEPLGQGASSAWAQGGVAAAMALPDTPEAHARDTLRAGAGLVDPEVAASVTAEARARIFGLAELGAPFDRDDQGGFVQSREAAHSFARVVRVGGDSAGAAIMATLVAQVRATPSVQVLEGVSATGLLVEGGRVIGVALAREGQAPVALKAPAVLLASGGAGGLYALATNPARIRGQGLGLAARAGARIGDAEFLQFHPTAIDAGLDPAPLATEALRGEGAILINARGERFMEGLHPDQELAPRDVVARAVFAQSQAGLRPMLDTRTVLGARIDAAFPAVAAACRAAGIDPVHQPIPVAAAAHYHMGGVATDHRGRTSLYGLWACGEVACTGLHGANRLASNGLLEAVVYGRRAAIDIAGGLGAMTAPKVVLPETAPLPATDPALIARLRRTMSDHAGVIRTERGLIRALAEIARIEAMAPEDPHLLNMTAAATLIASAALLRQESRGGHYRADHPQVDGETGERRRMTLNLALACRAAALTEDAA